MQVFSSFYCFRHCRSGCRWFSRSIESFSILSNFLQNSNVGGPGTSLREILECDRKIMILSGCMFSKESGLMEIVHPSKVYWANQFLCRYRKFQTYKHLCYEVSQVCCVRFTDVLYKIHFVGLWMNLTYKHFPRTGLNHKSGTYCMPNFTLYIELCYPQCSERYTVN